MNILNQLLEIDGLIWFLVLVVPLILIQSRLHFEVQAVFLLITRRPDIASAISTHSFRIKDQPLILFAKQEDAADDGFLELGEIVQLDLSSELVVLSSCRSGLGKIDEAEGVIGMQKAFFDAGSKSVMVSLWDVNDKYTSYFMKVFYTQLADGKSKSEALRIAKLNFIKKHSANPYYWSAFVLSGNTSSIEIARAASLNIVSIFLFLLLISGIYFIVTRIRKRKSA